MKRAVAFLTLALAASVSGQALAESPGSGRLWFGMNLGMVAGNVDNIPCASGTNGDCSESGFFPAFGLNATFVGRNALRLRLIQGQEQDTNHKPLELAALYGPRMGRSWYALLGIGQIFNPDDDYPGDVTGLAWEFVFAPAARRIDAAFELSMYGNTLADADFVGVAVGMRFGKVR